MKKFLRWIAFGLIFVIGVCIVWNITKVIFSPLDTFFYIDRAEKMQLEYKPDFVCIYGEITRESAQRFIKEIKVLDQDPEVDTIRINLASIGGSPDMGKAICYVMEQSQKPIEVRCQYAYSTAVRILVSGTPGLRFIHENGDVMIHNYFYEGTPLIAGFFSICFFPYDKYEETKLAGLFSKKTGQPFKRVKQDMNNETEFSADEAVAYGFADSVIVKDAKATPVPASDGQIDDIHY